MDAGAFHLDTRQARRAFDRAARAADDPAVLQREVERRMFERLDYIRLDPARVVDAGCGTGRGLALLRGRYPNADLLGVDFAPAAIEAASHSESLFERARRILSRARRAQLCADFSRLPLRPGGVDMLWSNLALAWAADPLAVLREFHRVLAPGGLLMFSSYGPDTLKELKSAFSAASHARHVHSFLDMHDVGDMLVASGFAAPVMDAETITLTYPVGKGAWRKMLAVYESGRKDGKLPATIEVVYGHAWKGEPRVAADGRQIVKWANAVQR
jgi:malonyl-CoA O-methyltransferase